MYYFGTLSNTLAASPSGDGFSIATDIVRGYQPNVFNQIADGGISRRQSGIITVAIASPVQVTAVSDPAGLYSDSKTLTNGASYSLPAQPTASGYSFIGWYVDTNRVDDPNGFSTGTLSFTISNDTTFVAMFLPATADTDGDGLSDGYEMYYFGTLSNTPAASPSGDGFSLAADIVRGYQPNVFNQIGDGGFPGDRAGFCFLFRQRPK